MKADEFKRFCETFTNNTEAINRCVDCCNEIELETGSVFEAVFKSPSNVFLLSRHNNLDRERGRFQIMLNIVHRNPFLGL